MGSKLYVGNLSYNVTSSDLQAMFEKHGTVSSAEVNNDRDTGQSKGFGRSHAWDGVEVDTKFNDYLEEEIRYKTLNLSNPDEAHRLEQLAEKDNAQRFKDIQHLSEV